MRSLPLAAALACAVALLVPASVGASGLHATCGSTITQPGTYTVLHGCSGAGITISTGNVVLKLDGYTLNGPGSGNGIDAESVSQVRIEGPGRIRNYSIGLNFAYVTGSRVSYVAVRDSTGHGVALYDSSANVLAYDRVIGSIYHGFTLNGSNDNRLEQDVSSDNGDNGIYLASSSGNHLAENVLAGNGAGVDVADIGNGPANDNRINRNTVKDNSDFGIALESGADGNRVSRNTARGNGVDDLYDGNGSCGANSWVDNTFVTASPVCIR